MILVQGLFCDYCWPGPQSSESVNGAGGPTYMVTRSYLEICAGCWEETSVACCIEPIPRAIECPHNMAAGFQEWVIQEKEQDRKWCIL